MRTDMTVWLTLARCGDLFGETAELAQDIIMAERLLRSARHSGLDVASGRWHAWHSDGANGALWLMALLQSGAARWSSDMILDVSYERAHYALTDLLSEVYACEEAAAQHPGSGARRLLELADGLRGRLFDTGAHRRVADALLQSLVGYATSVPLDFSVHR